MMMIDGDGDGDSDGDGDGDSFLTRSVAPCGKT